MNIKTKFDIGDEFYDIKVALSNNPMLMKVESFSCKGTKAGK